MDTWHFLLYGVACCLALRTLVTLMANHQKYFIEQSRMNEQASQLEAAARERDALKQLEKTAKPRTTTAKNQPELNANSGTRIVNEENVERAA